MYKSLATSLDIQTQTSAQTKSSRNILAAPAVIHLYIYFYPPPSSSSSSQKNKKKKQQQNSVDFRVGNRPCGLPTFLTFTFSFLLKNSGRWSFEFKLSENRKKKLKNIFEGFSKSFRLPPYFSFPRNKDKQTLKETLRKCWPATFDKRKCSTKQFFEAFEKFQRNQERQRDKTKIPKPSKKKIIIQKSIGDI